MAWGSLCLTTPQQPRTAEPAEGAAISAGMKRSWYTGMRGRLDRPTSLNSVPNHQIYLGMKTGHDDVDNSSKIDICIFLEAEISHKVIK